MLFERIKSSGLAHNSYLIGSRGHAAVVDPRRDCQVYADTAAMVGLNIDYIFETHRNEDYLIGSLELRTLTGAAVYHGPGLEWKYGATLKDGQVFRVGHLEVRALHTPGHTDESMSYVVTDLSSGSQPVMVFSGDTLLVDEVGRTDLYGPGEVRRLAAEIYSTIFDKILPLGDGVILCPAHGGGSVCGGAISDRDESTLGIERMQSPMLGLKKRAFLKRKAAERLEAPPYFKQMERLNLQGPSVLGHLPSPRPLGAHEFRVRMEEGAVVVDTRLPPGFCGAHIEGAYSIWLEGLSAFAGWVLPYDRPLLLVLEDEAHLDTAVRQLIRVGYDSLAGCLRNGMEGWYDGGLPIQGLPSLSVYGLKAMLDAGRPVTVLDVRGEEEWRGGHIAGALHIYVGHLEQRLAEVPRDKPVAVLCNVGRRASLGASILQRAGYPRVYNVLGSMAAWHAAGYPVTTE